MANINVIGDLNKSGLTKKEFEGVVEAVFDTLKKEKGVNIALVSVEDMRVKNLEYRKKDEPTDVLSFDYGDEGDILLCLDVIDKYRDEEGLKDATLKTLIHGTLHLFEYDHKNDKDHAIMEKMGNKIWRILG